MKRVCLVALAATMFAAPAFAQDEGEALRAAAPQAPIDRTASLLTGIEVTTGQDNATAAIRGNYTLSEGRGRFDTFSIAFSTPLNKSGPETLLGTLDGLTNATALELGFHQVRARLLPFEIDRVIAICNQARVALGREPSEESCEAELFDADAAQPFYDPYLAATLGVDSAWLWGVSARVGHQEFTYYDGATLQRISTDETPWSTSVYLARALPERGALFGLTLTAQDGFKDARSQVLCPGGAPPVTCVSGPIGAPSEVERRMVTGEYRQELPGQGLGFSFAATYDFETEEYGFDLPIYFLRGGDALTGGLRLGWRSDEHEVTVGLIISKPFSFMSFGS